MATTGFGNDSVPVTRMEALATELRLLKSGMADMQGRLDALLTEISIELPLEPAASEPSVEALPDLREQVELQAVAEVADVEPAIIADTDETAPAEDIEDAPVAILETPAVEAAIVVEAEAIEPSAAVTESTEIEAQIEIATEASAAEVAADAIEIVADATEIVAEDAIEATTLADLPAEPLVLEAVAIEAPAVEAVIAKPANIIVLAERRAAPRKTRTVVAQVGRWAAVIVLIAVAAAVAATGTGFASNGGELLIVKQVCALAADACTMPSGIP